MSLLRGRLLIEGGLVPGTIRLAEGRISAVDLEPLAPDALQLPIVAPGLIDLHVHGFGGANPLSDLGGMSRALARAGTTGFLATTFPGAPEELGRRCAAIWKSAGELAEDEGARVIGLHLEGPFVNPLKAGALNVDDLAEPSVAGLRQLLGPATGDGRGVRAMTLAPELSGAGAVVEELVRSDVRVSLGHSLATAAEARAAARVGASGATHLYNAMSGVHHRDAGLAAFALSDDALVAEIIGDLVHVGEEAFAIALRARGPEGLALVSDALEGAGTGCDVFESHGHRVVLDGGAFWIEDLDEEGRPRPRTLTGAATCQLEAVRRLVARGLVSVCEALRMASETPARALGLEDELGRLAVGARADLVVLAPHDLDLLEVRVAGRPFLPA